MNKLKHISLMIVMSLLFADSPNWEDNPGAYQFVSFLVGGIILNEGDQMGGDGDLFAAFDEDGNVRGVGVALSPPFGPYAGTPVWEMTMRSNADSDVLSFKYYDASTDEIFNLIETINFQANQQLGDVFNPRVFTHCDNPISCGIFGSDEIMQCDCNTIPEDFQFNISQMSAFYFFASATINGSPLDSDDWIGSFNGNVCVGARKWDLSQCNNNQCDIAAMGDSGDDYTEGYLLTGEYPTFKIYDASEDKYYDATPTDNYPFYTLGINSIDAINSNVDIYGCMDDNACNYNASATVGDDSCVFSQGSCDCYGLPVDNYCDCNFNSLDECGVCGGDGPLENFDCNENCIPGYDCLGQCGGIAEYDECGVCDGGGISEGECDCNGNTLDECGICGGDNSSCTDCLGVINGTAELDNCNVCEGNCDGSGSCDLEDCNGACNGSAELDNCGVCDDDGNNDCQQDCFGVWGGTAELDNCNVCNGSNECVDCAGVPNGDAVEDCDGVCNGNNNNCEDCLGNQNGLAYEDSCGVCDSDLDNDCLQDCLGDWGGIAEVDLCGVCNGDNSSCTDCLGVIFGSAYEDNCGVCNNDSTDDCVPDCNGEFGGDLVFDQCGICGGDNSTCLDCAGNPNGSAYIDMCGECDDYSGNDCEQDCYGIWGGGAEQDICGICDGDGTLCLDCANTPYGDAYLDDCEICNSNPNDDCQQGCDLIWGSGLEYDECGICGGDNSTCLDCEGNPNGSAYYDICNVCDSNPDNDCEQDCEGEWGGPAILDECGICDGDNSSCADCFGIPNGDNVLDACGVCDSNSLNDCEEDCNGIPGGGAEFDECGICGGDGTSCDDCDGDYDSCGVCNGDDSDCWYIDIDATIYNEQVPYACVPYACYSFSFNQYFYNINNQYTCEEELDYNWIMDVENYSNEIGCNENGFEWIPNQNFCMNPESYDPLEFQEDCGSDGICVAPQYFSQEICEDNGNEWVPILAVNSGQNLDQDLNNRIGMHIAADDNLNTTEDSAYFCGADVSCYTDVVEPPDGFNTDVKFYFPHPEWDNMFGDFSDYTRDIRKLTDLSDFQENRIWNAVFSTELQNVEVALTFDFINNHTIMGQYGYSRVWVLHNGLLNEILDGEAYVFNHYEEDDLLQIIIGTPEAMPKAGIEIVSPNGNEVLSINNPLDIELKYPIYYDFVQNIKLNLQLKACKIIENGETSFVYVNQYQCEEVGGDWVIENDLEIYNEIPNAIQVNDIFIESIQIDPDIIQLLFNDNANTFNNNSNLYDNDYIGNFSIHAEIIDFAGGDRYIFGDDYMDDSNNIFTFSNNTITSSFDDGWHLLTPPLNGEHLLQNVFANPTYTCSEENGCDPISVVNSGEGFYIESDAVLADYTFNGEVEGMGSVYINPGWNLVGYPLVSSMDVDSIKVIQNNQIYNWNDAVNQNIISATPIIYDNQRASHVGTKILSISQGFWIYSGDSNVELSFNPYNAFSMEDESNYWEISLFAKENTENNIHNYEHAIGSEVVIGIHEDELYYSNEDQKLFPLDRLDGIMDSYTQISIVNNDENLYKDIRENYFENQTWNVLIESKNPFDVNAGIDLEWDFNGKYEYYDYYLNLSDISINMLENHKVTIYQEDNITITSILKSEYAGCTNPEADNFDPNAIGGNQALYCDILTLSLQDVYQIDPESEEQEFSIPITLLNTQNEQIEAIQFHLEYDPSMIEISDEHESLLPNYIVEDVEDGIPNQKIIYYQFDGLESDSKISDSEIILMNLKGKGVNNGSTNITFSFILIETNFDSYDYYGNYGSGCQVNIGMINLDIYGSVNYYSSNYGMRPINDVEVALTDVVGDYDDEVQESNDDGGFVFESVQSSRYYNLNLFKGPYGGNQDYYFDGLSAVDASRIARYATQKLALEKNQIYAANVRMDYRCFNGSYVECEEGMMCDELDGNYNSKLDCETNGGSWLPYVDATDVSRVARYAAGVIDSLSFTSDNLCGDRHWMFLNPDNSLMIDEDCNENPYQILPLENNIHFQFTAIRLGDVTGNWSKPLGRENNQPFIDNEYIEVELEESISLPIYIQNEESIEGVDISIIYDPESLVLQDFSKRNGILDNSLYEIITNYSIPGEFRFIGYAISNPIDVSGLLGNLNFKVIGNNNSSSNIEIEKMTINETSSGGFLIQNGVNSGFITRSYEVAINSIPEVFKMNQNYPNPFNPSTNISFELPVYSEIQIAIFNIQGEFIEFLVDGEMESGYHQLKWDGSKFATGIYFVRMIADNGRYQKILKVSLVK